jgi:RNA-directed DNA polymerase
MASIRRFLSERLKLKVNEAKSQVARPSARKFLGYSVTAHRQPKLKVAAESTRRLCEKVRQIIRRGRGRNLRRLIAEELNPLLRGWANYFRLAETKGVFEELDQWLRRKLRCIIWRQWKRPRTRLSKLLGLGFTPAKARTSAYNGYGPWWNSGQAHMNAAFPQSYFARMGLISLLQTIHARA